MVQTLLIVSDTHLDINSSPDDVPDSYLPKTIVGQAKRVDAILHAGDYYKQDAYDAFSALADRENIELFAVKGNSEVGDPGYDSIHDSEGYLLPDWIRIPKKKYGLSIGLIHDVFNRTEKTFSEYLAKFFAERNNVDVLIFGHIHQPTISWAKSSFGKRHLLLSPGRGGESAADYHKSSPCAILLSIDDGEFSNAEIIRME